MSRTKYISNLEPLDITINDLPKEIVVYIGGGSKERVASALIALRNQILYNSHIEELEFTPDIHLEVTSFLNGMATINASILSPDVRKIIERNSTSFIQFDEEGRRMRIKK